MEQFKYPNYKYVTIVEIPHNEISKIDFALCQQPKESLETFYARQINKPQILINGGFFVTASGDTIFNFIDEREVISSTENYKWGMGIANNKLTYCHLDQTILQDFVSGYPNLIDDYKPVLLTFAEEIDYLARRTVLGYNDEKIFIITIDSPGMRFAEMQKMLYSLHVRYAINLDGGGSTRMLIDGKRVTEELWSRPIDNVVAFYLQEPEPTLFRVQVGAYGIKVNADKMRTRIIALEDTIGAGYRNAYVRFIGGFYKCQVGAFSIKTNAEKVLNDLKSKGFDAFITT
jgi:hypothetical protein